MVHSLLYNYSLCLCIGVSMIPLFQGGQLSEGQATRIGGVEARNKWNYLWGPGGLPSIF